MDSALNLCREIGVVRWSEGGSSSRMLGLVSDRPAENPWIGAELQFNGFPCVVCEMVVFDLLCSVHGKQMHSTICNLRITLQRFTARSRADYSNLRLRYIRYIQSHPPTGLFRVPHSNLAKEKAMRVIRDLTTKFGDEVWTVANGNGKRRRVGA